ncbi:AAA family ATPase [Methylocaldum sp. 14B]|jgi:putative DNA primase/helicase|uniref:AAA family ATPase n=1 Tax=Methylocaldum sp. 14B TaxID=1912213 RepID=UPI000989AE60|nr:AAA family ATPase [Methylocaldum sp. 14B]
MASPLNEEPISDLNELVTDLKRYVLLEIDDLAAQPPQRYRIKPVFPETGIAAIFGPSASGKSFLAFDMAGAIAGRDEWFGFRVRNAPVIYLYLEGEGGARNRIAAYRTQYGGASLANMRFVIESFDLLSNDPLSLSRTIKDAGLERPTIFIDTLNRAATGADENSSVDMGHIIAACKQIQAETGGLVVIVHHTGKDGTKGLRGHSSLFAAMDAAIQVSRYEDRREWALAKSKDGQDGLTHAFNLKVIDLGEDDDGDPVTSCVVEPLEAHSDRVKKPKMPTGGNQKIAWTWFSSEFEERYTIPFDEAVREIGARLSVSPDRRGERAREAITGLINRALLSLLDGSLSSPAFSPNPEPYKYGFGAGDKKTTRSSPKTGNPGKRETADYATAGGFDL